MMITFIAGFFFILANYIDISDKTKPVERDFLRLLAFVNLCFFEST